MITMKTDFTELGMLRQKYPELRKILNICLPEEADSYNTSKTIFDLGERNAYNAMISLNLILEEIEAKKTIYTFLPETSEDVGVFIFNRYPGKKWCFIVPGGDFQSIELFHSSGIPIAIELDKLELNVAVLRHRVKNGSRMSGALDDLAAAISDTVALHPEAKEYAVFGFSSGGMITGLWGTESLGYEKYGLPKPEAVVCASTPFSTCFSYDILTYNMASGIRLRELRQFFENAFGKDFTKERIMQYSTELLVTKNYPAVYMIHGERDSKVYIHHAEIMEQALSEKSIPYIFQRVPDAPHNFGKGYNTAADGWLSEAVRFWMEEA